MAQSATTVTPDGPTPPTNFTGQIGMRPPTTAGLNPIDDGAAGVLTAFAAPSAGGAPYEGAGTEVVVTATSTNPSPFGQTQTVSDLGNFTATPNADHASSLSPSTPPAITGLVPASTASGAGTVALEVDGTHFTPQSVVYVNGVAQATVFVSATKLTVAAAPKKAAAGTLPVTVVTGGAITTAPTNWTFT
jgi:hypothetical protein